mmetsp:Transcript_29698/g.50556  ORF Transcript_29698/g.50556 Transcript_29698/m.50556 type:complete len:93 (-) Transcript_29698:172-450(-)
MDRTCVTFPIANPARNNVKIRVSTMDVNKSMFRTVRAFDGVDDVSELVAEFVVGGEYSQLNVSATYPKDFNTASCTDAEGSIRNKSSHPERR